MRIMFVIPTLGTGGAERVASILANYFSENNSVEIFIMEESEVERYPISKNIQIKEAGIVVKRGNKVKVIVNFLSNYMQQRRLLKKELQKFKPEIVISFLPKADMLMASLKGQYYWIGSERNDPMSRNNIERKILNLIYKRTDMLVCQTQKVSEFYEKKGIKNTSVIRNPLIINEKSISEIKTEDRFVVAVGRLDKQKNYSMLIKAFAYVKQKKSIKEKLYIIGDGPQKEELQNIINTLSMQKDILLLGRKNNVRDYLNKAVAFIMSSNYEGLPNAMLEAMDASLPIISTDFFTGAAREFVDEANGYLVSVGNCKELARAIYKLLSKEPLELKQMGKISKQRVESLNVVSISKQWEHMLKSVLKEY